MATPQQFWNWFSENHFKYQFLNEVPHAENERLMDEFLTQLHAYSDELYFQIGGYTNGNLELIITAEGIRERFSLVERLVDCAPDVPGWVIIKFKPAHDGDFYTELDGRRFTPNDAFLIELYSDEFPDDIGIRVCYDDYTEEQKNLFTTATYLMIDNLVGEKSSTLDIDYLEIARVPEGRDLEDLKKLSTLPRLIKERKVLKFPVSHFKVHEVQIDGYKAVSTINMGYKDYRHKAEFPYHLTITLPVESGNENGHPIGSEADKLNSFEDFLEEKLQSVATMQYIGRTTIYKKRCIHYYTNEKRIAAGVLDSIRDSGDALAFHYDISHDPEWSMTSDLLG